jgi:hypothetical protein
MFLARGFKVYQNVLEGESNNPFIFASRFTSWVSELSQPRSNWTGRVLIVALWVLSIIASVFIFSVFVEPFLASLFAPKTVSEDWSGYVAFSDLQNPQPSVTGVSAQWTVPGVTSFQRYSYSAAWIGIGGYVGDGTLIQVGTEQDSQNGVGAYSAWYELLSGNVITIYTINLSAGDEISASINLKDSNSSIWTVEITDVTKGQTFKQDFQYDSSRLSAEWIVERPTVGGRLGTLADFGEVTFTNSAAKMSAAGQAIDRFPNKEIVMYSLQGKALVSVSPLGSDGSTFTVTYLANGTTTQTILTSSDPLAAPGPQSTAQPILTQKKRFDTVFHRKVASSLPI